jgi:hypothetical protein
MKRKVLPFVFMIVGFLFFSCEKSNLSLEEIYETLPEIEHVSQNYSVNGQILTERVKFHPPGPRTNIKHPMNLKYQETELTTIYHTATNSFVIMFAADTKIGNVCSVYESQGNNNRLAFINGKAIDVEPTYAIIGLKVKDDHFIFLMANQAYKKYVIYRP